MAAVSCILALAGSASAYAPAPKARLRGLFKGEADPVLACPVEKTPLCSEATVLGMETRRALVSELGVRYPVTSLYNDILPSSSVSKPLTVDALGRELADSWSSRVQTGTFRSPLTAFLYERGWRQGFARAGFPGIEKEFEEASDFFASAAGGVVVDMSCGSGLMTRRLLRSGAYSRLLALDYSEAMLRETCRRISAEGLSTDTLTVCRADVAALPLRDGSIDAMHAGAALHCWPQLESGLAEIARVLKPGGRFFGTTFLKGAYGLPRTAPGQQGGANGFRFFDGTAELVELFVAAGFPAEGVVVRKEGQGCAVVRAEMLAPSEVVGEAVEV